MPHCCQGSINHRPLVCHAAASIFLQLYLISTVSFLFLQISVLNVLWLLSSLWSCGVPSTVVLVWQHYHHFSQYLWASSIFFFVAGPALAAGQVSLGKSLLSIFCSHCMFIIFSKHLLTMHLLCFESRAHMCTVRLPSHCNWISLLSLLFWSPLISGV